MKKLLLLLFVTVVAFTASGQTYIPNGNFETWTSGTYSTPQNYLYSSSSEKVSSFLKNSVSFNVVKSTSSYAGNYAVQLSTVLVGADTVTGYFLNSSPNSGSASTWHGGVPYTQKPTGIRGYYKYNVATADSALIIVAFSKAGSNIGTYSKKIGGIHSSYTLFNLTFSPALTQTPDSVIFAATSSYSVMSNKSGPIGSTLVIDSVSFTGAASQPTAFNGSFETWADSTVSVPSGWYLDNGNESITGVHKTTTAYKGSAAVELKTYLGKMNNQKAARPGYISTGYYTDNCGGNCTQHGGQPFTNQIDTLAFYYKYTPSGSDSAQVTVNLKKSGSSIGWYSAILHSASSWTYVEIPVANITVPDTVIINAQSSYYADSLVSFVGSDLIVDNIQFKSQPLAAIFNVKADNSVNIYPNPTSDAIQITGINGKATIQVSDINGKVFLTKQVTSPETVSLSSLPQGAYLVQIATDNGIVQRKLVKK
ncbi:MAG: T9SS type A sorting domain-containing protein [Paludibacteraceae bacterium]|nr:T9SS type A sorting domain-containing protein [Paludibacteraceae bacterium]